MKNSRIALLAATFAACAVQHQPPPTPTGKLEQAASAEPTLATIVVDGQFSDWNQVLTNPLQVTLDGNGLDGAGCYPTPNADRDCDDFTTQADVATFAWTYDATNVHVYLERPPSASSLTYSFIMDVDADGMVEVSDRVLQVEWQSGGAALRVRLYAYDPVDDTNGDPIACPGTAACVAAGNDHAELDFIDGYDLPGTLGALLWSPPAPVPGCAGSVAGDECGGDGLGTSGRRFEAYVPWSELIGGPGTAPIIWHVASSTNTAFNAASDNVGGPDGKAGLFGSFSVDFFPDRVGSASSPGQVEYCHTVQNTGDFSDRYNLRAVSNIGSTLTFFRADGACVRGSQFALDSNGDGDFTDPGDSLTGGDSNGDGLPDTGLLGAAATANVIVRIDTPLGVIGATDVTIATARSALRPALVFDDAMDRTRIGPVTVQPDHGLSGTPGASVDFGPFTVVNNTGTDTFDLFVRSSNGYPLQLFRDSAGALGTLIATDSNGDGTWDAATPNTGPLATSGTVSYWVRETIPGGAAINTVDSMRLTATSQTAPQNSGAAQNTLRVLDALSISPSYTAPNGRLFGLAGSSVYLPHRVINSHSAAQTVSLTQTGSALPAGWSIRWWTDPNGDGSIADGAVTTSFALPRFGGTMNLVAEVGIPASASTGSSSAAATTVTGSIVGSASANDHVSVGNLQTYADALFARPSRFFPACSTVFARAAALTPLQAAAYRLRFDDSLGATVQSGLVATNGWGAGSGAYTLALADGPGAWRVRALNEPAGTTVYDLNPFTVERSGTVIAQAPAVAVDGPLPVSAQLTNTAQQSDYSGTRLVFVLRDPSNALIASTDAALAPVPYGSSAVRFDLFPSVSLPAYGNYTVTATWLTSCGSTIGSGSTTVVRAPSAPALLTPADGATVGTATPTLTGTAEPSAVVTVTLDGAVAGTASADGSGDWSFNSSGLAQGAHSWSATQTVGGATSPPSVTFDFNVDTVAPAAPTVATPANGSSVATTLPTVTGAAEANATVTVRFDGSVAGTATATGAGTWTFTPTTPLAQGSHTVNATATDGAGNVSGASSTNTFTVDTLVPSAPVVATPVNGSAVGSTTPLVTGTAEAGATVTVRLDGLAAGTATANGAGSWTFTPPTPLSQGSHTVNATATDAAGNLSASSNTNTFTVDSVVPAAPVVATPASGAVVVTVTPVVTGTAEANATVTVRFDGVVAGTATANGAGNWTFTPTTPLSQGSHTVNATATDAGGGVSGTSNTNTFTLDTVAPAAPVVTAPANGARTNDTTPEIRGTAEANATVAVLIDGSPVGTTTAGGTGSWAFVTTVALSQGSHTARARATDAAGNQGATSGTNTFTVDLAPPAAPVITAPVGDALVTDSTPTVSGTAEPGATVTVRVDGIVVGTTVANQSGNWSFTVPSGSALSDGSHTLTASATDAAGNTGPASGGTSITVDATPPSAPVVAPSGGSATSDNTPTFSGTAEPFATVQVFIDGMLAGTVTADAQGNWTFTPSTPMTDGSHTTTARATDAAGHTSAASTGSTFTVDTAAPSAPVVGTPANDSTVTDSTPTISGTTEANASVAVSVDGQVVGTVTADAEGNWSFTPTTALDEGSRTVTASATDAAGNTGAASPPSRFTIRTGGGPGGAEPPFIGYHGGGCGCGTTDASAALGLGLLALSALARRRRV